MKIAQIISGTGLNGSVRHGYELTGELAAAGHQVLVLYRAGSWLSEQSYPRGVEHSSIRLHRSPGNLRAVARLLREREIDVIHSHNSSAHFFTVLIARLFRFRCVATSHMTLFQPHWWWNDRVIAPSESTAKFQRWFNAVSRRRIDVIPNFINTNRFQPTRTRAEMRSELGLSASDFAIAVVGEVNARKSQHVLVEAVPELSRSGVNPQILLIGNIDPSYRPRVESAISLQHVGERVRLLGMRHDVADLLVAVDCCCLPSSREVMPIALLEAMSVGLPAVGTSVGGIPECIRDGSDGFVVPPNQPRALAQAITKLAIDENLRRRMGVNARQNMLDSFSPAACLPKIVSSYRAACRQKQIAA